MNEQNREPDNALTSFRWNPREYIETRLSEQKPEPIFVSEDPTQQKQQQEKLREQLQDLLVLPSQSEGLLSLQVLSIEDFPHYRREFVTFESREGVTVCGFFLLPSSHGKDNKSAPLSAVLCLPGHGRGVDPIMGILPDGSQRKWGQWDEYANDYALQCVKEGYAVFALEQISFGRRRDAQAQASGNPDLSSCTRDAMAALMLGETLPGWRVWDAMKAIDYLLSRPEVDPEKIAVLGISGGGTITLLTSCLDTRVSACVVSGYFNTFRDSILAVDHCVDNYVPNILSLCEMPELAGLLAPRLFFAESGAQDPIFPLAGFERAITRAHEIYSLFGAKDNFGFEVFMGGHVFNGEGAFSFLKEKWR